MRRFLLLLSALALGAPIGLAPAPALAQWNVAYDGCQAGGRSIPSIPSPSVDGMAQARIDPAFGPAIYYNPARMNRARPETRTFAYFHECAHLALGHTVGLAQPQGNEQAADCWAVRELFARHAFGPAQLQTVQAEHATNLWACLGR